MTTFNVEELSESQNATLNDFTLSESEFINAKSFLLQASFESGVNLYDHLAKVLAKVLHEKPENILESFEEISKVEKRSKFISKVDTILDKSDRNGEVLLAETQQNLFTKGEDADDSESETSSRRLPNLMELCYFLEQAGIGLNREEMCRIWLSLKYLVDTNQSIEKVRFWGKLFGIQSNYIVAEIDFKEGEGQIPDEEDKKLEGNPFPQEKLADEKETTANEQTVATPEVDTIPKPVFNPPPIISKETNGSGANKKTYFVCTEPGKIWIRLPPVQPAHIVIARKMKKFLTGRLDSPIISFPPFVGTEANYLRAQIARISASTLISPQGFYKFDEDEEEEEGEARDTFVEDEEYEAIPVKELIDPSLSNWVHHAQYILPQGRCTWFNPVQKNEDELEGEEEDEEREEPEEAEPESGPPLLTPLSEDNEIDGTQAWICRLSSKLVPQFAIAVVHSVLWPGAHAFAIDKKFENVYIGWGLKKKVDNYEPPLPSQIQSEFPSGPEITETEDPTPEEEADLRKAAEEEAAAEEELDEEGDDDDDDDEND